MTPSHYSLSSLSHILQLTLADDEGKEGASQAGMEQELCVRNTCSIVGWVGILHNPILKVTMYHYISHLHNVQWTLSTPPTIFFNQS